MRSFAKACSISLLVACCLRPALNAADLATSLEKISPTVLRDGESLAEMLERDISDRLKAANARSTAAWRELWTRTDWEEFRKEKLAALRDSLGGMHEQPPPLTVQIAGELREDGYVIRKIQYLSRPGFSITGLLYVPSEPPRSMPGLLLSHSHHSPKSQGELQEMGALWARAGCVVLVPDHVGHGERRQHPFATASDYSEPFQLGRQDYHFRFNTAIQLYLVGESLMGWMAWDLMRGVDVLLDQPGIDPERIALLGAVAGGGDPAGVTAALDERIKVVVPFNFGGPQPETRYPLPADAEERFDYAGGGSWESTRNLRRSASDGFLPWVIVGSVAPRAVIHAHEFAWDGERDPVWKRYERIFSLFNARDRLGYTHGFGRLSGQPPDASHCNNIGRAHRERIHETLKVWWGIAVDETRPVVRHSAAELTCRTLAEDSALPDTPLYQLAGKRADARAAELDQRLEQVGEVRQQLRIGWKQALGSVEPYPIVEAELRGTEALAGVQVEKLLLHGEREIRLPTVLLLPTERPSKIPVVLVLAQEGKAELLKRRAALLSRLLEHAAVCLVDVRGTGESRADDGRGRRSADTSFAASELMLSETLLGARLRDVRSVMAYLRERPELEGVAVLGDSLAEVNGADVKIERPLELEQPVLAEPLGPTLAMLAGLFEDDLLAVAARGGLIDYRSLTESQFIHVPFDVIVPNVTAVGDLPQVARGAGEKHPLWISGLVDGRNRSADVETVQERYGAVARPEGNDDDLAKWLIGELAGK